MGGTYTAAEEGALQDLIDSMSLAIEARVGCQILDRSVVEYLDGGVKTLHTEHPIVSVTPIASPDATVITAANYYFTPRSHLLRHSANWPHAYTTNSVRAKWIVTYVGGIMASPSDDLRLACGKAVAWAYEKRGSSPDASSIGVGSLSVSYSGGRATASTLPDDVESLIGKYVRIVI